MKLSRSQTKSTSIRKFYYTEAYPLTYCCRDAKISHKRKNTQKLVRFHHNSMQSILNIKKRHVQSKRIKNEEVRKRFGNISSMQDNIARRQQKFIGKVVQVDKQKIPRKILTSFLTTSQPDGGKHMSTRDVIYENKKNCYKTYRKMGTLANGKDMQRTKIVGKSCRRKKSYNVREETTYLKNHQIRNFMS